MLQIDYRERSIIDLIKSSEFIEYETVNLAIGDFIISTDNEINFIIERKTINDLAASITDNRFLEQKQRLLESTNDPTKIIFIIEGKKHQNKFSRIPVKTINSAIINLIFKHNFKVIFTENIDDTLFNVLLLYNKVKNKELELKFKQSLPIKLVKKSDNNTKNSFINQLGVINGVSLNIANKIKDNYKCMSTLVHEFHKNKNLLIDIQLTDKRKLGQVLNDKIYNSLYESNEQKDI